MYSNQKTSESAPVLASLKVSQAERQVTCAIPICCKPATLYSVWADVANWHTWDPDTRWARLDGPFTVGSSGRLAPKKGMAVTMQLTHVVPDQMFTVQCAVLGSQMIFSHTLVEQEQGVVATHQVQFRGWLAGILMRTVGADVAKGLPVTMSRLKALCESHSSTLAA